MYLHVGCDYMVKNSEIIAIFNSYFPDIDNMNEFLADNEARYEIIDATGGEGCYSYILTEDKIYLSSISSLTLKKRIEENVLTDSLFISAEL